MDHRFLTKTDDVLLDRITHRLDSGDYDSGLDLLFGGLLNLREELAAPDWRAFAKGDAIEHPLRDLVHTDPMTRRSFEKPRGYAGDAVLLDYIYGFRTPGAGDERARAVYRFAIERPAAQAVRRRRERIAERIDETAERAGRPIRVLSIAAGHLRELHLARAYSSGQVEELVALDSDPESCVFLQRTFPRVRVRNEPFTELFRDREVNGAFDFVYSAGLFDYLQNPIATKLTRKMFSMLRPGGTLLWTNFLPTVVDAGYMESYMGWDLIYRDRAQLGALGARVPVDEIGARRVYADSQRAIGYLEVTRG